MSKSPFLDFFQRGLNAPRLVGWRVGCGPQYLALEEIPSLSYRRPLWLVGFKKEGLGLDGGCSIYQGHLLFQKATYGCT